MHLRILADLATLRSWHTPVATLEPMSELVHIVDDLPDFGTTGEVGLVMVYALDGFLDAGSATAIAMQHLLAADAGRVVASFDVDSMYDYRARRPPMTFHEQTYTEYDAPRLVVRLCHDSDGVPFLLMSGPEPDFRWEAFAAAVRTVVGRLGVRLSVSLGAVPMAVPHTRPVIVTNHATDPALLIRENLWKGRIRIPSSAVAMVETRLGEWGEPAMGFVAHVPHYLAGVDYPAASIELLTSVETATGLRFDLAPLRVLAESAAGQIASQVEDNDEVKQVVGDLERQYDLFRDSLADGETLPLAEAKDLPTAEELGAELEAFLAGLDTPDD